MKYANKIRNVVCVRNDSFHFLSALAFNIINLIHLSAVTYFYSVVRDKFIYF